jgi:hypothetical protein
MIIGSIGLLCGLSMIVLGYIARGQVKNTMWLGAALSFMSVIRLLPNAGTGLWATLFVLAMASLVASLTTMNLRVIPWKRPEFFLLGATMVMLAASYFVNDAFSDTKRALIALSVVLAVASIVMVMRGVVHMLRSAGRASHR